jgi:hypothetical protein
MENLNELIEDLIAKFLATGSAELNEDGLNIKMTNDNGIMSITCESPVKDNTIIKKFEAYIDSLSDDFFVEVAESFKNGELKAIQDKLESNNNEVIKEGIDTFMAKVKEIASSKVDELNSDIKATEKDLSDLIELRNSYIHVLNKEF